MCLHWSAPAPHGLDGIANVGAAVADYDPLSAHRQHRPPSAGVTRSRSGPRCQMAAQTPLDHDLVAASTLAAWPAISVPLLSVPSAPLLETPMSQVARRHLSEPRLGGGDRGTAVRVACASAGSSTPCANAIVPPLTGGCPSGVAPPMSARTPHTQRNWSPVPWSPMAPPPPMSARARPGSMPKTSSTAARTLIPACQVVPPGGQQAEARMGGSLLAVSAAGPHRR